MDLLRLYSGVVHWDLMFIHSIQDWELESFTALMDLLYMLRQDMALGVGYAPWNFSLENYIKISGPTPCCFFCLNCGIGENPDNR